MKKLGWALAIWGGVGVVNQFLLISALQTGTAPAVPLVGQLDPASVLKVANPQGAGITSPGMLTDAAILGGGLWLANRISV